MLSEKPWRGEAVVHLLIGLFTTFCIIKLIWVGIDGVTGNLPEMDKKLLDAVMGALSFQGAALVWIRFFLRREQLTWNAAFGFRNSNPARVIMVGIATAIVVVPIAWLLQYLSVEFLGRFSVGTDPQQIVKTFQETQKAGSGYLRQQVVFGVSVILLAPIAEELLFRGLIYPTFKQLGHRHIALWASSVLFAVLHANLPSLLPFIFLGMVLVVVYERTDNLLVPIITHSFFNTANFVYMLYEEPINTFLKRG